MCCAYMTFAEVLGWEGMNPAPAHFLQAQEREQRPDHYLSPVWQRESKR